MSFEHKYLKYKQKYLELKNQLENMEQVGGTSNNDSILDLDKLSDTPTFNNNVKHLAGYLQDSSEQLKESETDTDLGNVNELTETPRDNTLVVNIESSTDESKELQSDSDNEKSDSSEKKSEDDSSSPSPSEQEGGNIETSISELEEIFSQLGGKKKDVSSSEDSEDSDDSSLSSLSSLDDSSSDFDF